MVQYLNCGSSFLYNDQVQVEAWSDTSQLVSRLAFVVDNVWLQDTCVHPALVKRERESDETILTSEKFNNDPCWISN